VKNVLRLLLLLIATIVVVGVRPVSAEDKVDICHFPPGNPSNVQFITVGASAVPAHLAHGDFLAEEGSCQITG
jgi:hypothetical protein